jgi:hypothetical protein
LSAPLLRGVAAGPAFRVRVMKIKDYFGGLTGVSEVWLD